MVHLSSWLAFPWWKPASQSQSPSLGMKGSTASTDGTPSFPSPIRLPKKLARVFSSSFLLDGRRVPVSPFLHALLIFSTAFIFCQAMIYHALFLPTSNSLPLTPAIDRAFAAQLGTVLHDSFQIPHKFIRQLSLQHRDRLLSALRAQPSRIGRRRRVLFAHIHSEHGLLHRVSTLASVLTFAKNSGRVPVVIWHHSRPYATFQHLFSVHNASSQCSPLIVESVLGGQDGPYPHPENDSDPNSEDSDDWAELSLLENFYSDHTAKSNSTMAKMLEKAAVGDQHISLSLSKPLISAYSSRTDSVHLVQSCLVGRMPVARTAISTAFLLALARQKSVLNRGNEAVFRMLHLRFNIPIALLDGIRPVTRRILLDRLLAKEVLGNPTPRVAFVQPQYGLGNRLRAVGSMWAYARATDRVLVVIWGPDFHMDCALSDLFVGHDDVIISNHFSPNEEFPFRENGRADRTMHHVKWYNYMRTQSNVSHAASVRLDVPDTHHVYASSAYVIQSDETPGIIRTQSKLWRILRELTPQIKVARLVESATAGLFSGASGADVIGVHIRSRTIETDVAGVDAGDYTQESAKQTDFWRKSTNVGVFLDEMRKYPPHQRFYVAADKSEVTAIFEREFPGRITYTRRDCDSRGSDCIPYALADVLLLSKCKTLLGSYWSSFSELSCRWGGARYRLAGADFGRPKNATPKKKQKRRSRKRKQRKAKTDTTKKIETEIAHKKKKMHKKEAKKPKKLSVKPRRN